MRGGRSEAEDGHLGPWWGVGECCLGVLFWMSWEGNGEENPAMAPLPPGLAQNVLECCKGSRWGELKEAFSVARPGSVQFPAWVWFSRPWLTAQGKGFIHQHDLCAPGSPSLFMTIPLLPSRMRSPSVQTPTLFQTPGIHPLRAFSVPGG